MRHASATEGGSSPPTKTRSLAIGARGWPAQDTARHREQVIALTFDAAAAQGSRHDAALIEYLRAERSRHPLSAAAGSTPTRPSSKAGRRPPLRDRKPTALPQACRERNKAYGIKGTASVGSLSTRSKGTAGNRGRHGRQAEILRPGRRLLRRGAVKVAGELGYEVVTTPSSATRGDAPKEKIREAMLKRAGQSSSCT